MFKKLLSMLCMCTFALAAHATGERDIKFNLVDHKGPVTEKSYPGKYLLLAIGYTACPDICPTTLYEYKLALQDLKNPDALQPLFVTIDPVNDEVGRLNEYTRYFDERIVGLSGEMKNIQSLADQLGATFGYRLDGKKLDNPKPGDAYTVYHSALVYLIGPDRKLVDVFDYQIGGAGLARELNKVLGDAPGQAPAKTENKADSKTSSAAAAAKAAAAATCPLPEGFQPTEHTATLHDVLPGADLKKPTLLNVWALWCAPCRVELPVLEKLAATQKDLHVQTLNLGDKTEGVDQLFAKMNLTHLPKTISTDKTLLSRMDAKGLPLTALFVNGKQVARKSGIIDKTDSIAAYGRCMAAT